MPLQRIQKLIARYGHASRRKAEELIRDGRVRVDGLTIQDFGTKVPEDALIEVDGKVINKDVRKIYLLLNKPAGWLCSKRDTKGRKLVYDLVQRTYGEMGLFTVGRLDYMSEGLLLLTNDGRFAQAIGHPSGEIVKEYEVTASSPIPYNLIDAWKKGVYIKTVRYAISGWRKVNETTALISLHEGKNREIRKLFANIHVGIARLKRITIGSLTLGDLAPGGYRELLPEEIEELVPGLHNSPLSSEWLG